MLASFWIACAGRFIGGSLRASFRRKHTGWHPVWYTLLAVLLAQWVAAATLRRWQRNFMREDVALVAMRCSCLPGGLYWLSVAKVATSVVPPGVGASAFMIKFVQCDVSGALAVGSIGFQASCSHSSP